MASDRQKTPDAPDVPGHAPDGTQASGPADSHQVDVRADLSEACDEPAEVSETTDLPRTESGSSAVEASGDQTDANDETNRLRSLAGPPSPHDTAGPRLRTMELIDKVVAARDAFERESERILFATSPITFVRQVEHDLLETGGDPIESNKTPDPPNSDRDRSGAEAGDDQTEVDIPTDPGQPTEPTKDEQRLRWVAEAMLLVRDYPDWSDAAVARKVGKAPSSLSRCQEYKMAAAIARGDKRNLHRGHITVDSDSGLCDVEAVAATVEDSDDRLDRGQPIQGSKYFREYCAECEEPMKVSPDKVGANPVCESCRN